MGTKVQSHILAYLQQTKRENKGNFRQTSKSVTKDILYRNGVAGRINWSNLKRVSIRELKLFAPMEGSMLLEGRLICDPFTPAVGCTSLLEDDNGDVILIALYNFLPEGAVDEVADSIANSKIPKSSRIRIAEPFLKIIEVGSGVSVLTTPVTWTLCYPIFLAFRSTCWHSEKRKGMHCLRNLGTMLVPQRHI
jgi:hypothetical protein